MEEENSNISRDMHTGGLRAEMKFENAERLTKEYKKALTLCLQKIEHWEKLKKDYEVLRSRLETLPERITHDVMVPFGSLAFMPGQLIHTNEILTLLGANWFAEVSAKHAVEISNRRILQCEKMLKDLSDEKKQWENYLNYVNSAMSSDLVEILEHDDEDYVEKSKRRRIQHSKSNPVGKPAKKYEDLVKELDEVSNSVHALNLGNQACDEINENVSFDESDDLESSSEDDEDQEKDDDSSDTHLKSDGKHVKWKDQEGEKMKNRITFTHSSHKSKSHANSKPIAISKAKSKNKESVPLSPVNIQSPLDIYKCFSTKPEQCKPKSILKRTSSVDDSDVLPDSVTPKNIEDEPVLKTKFKEQTAFTGEVVEHGLVGNNLSEKIDIVQRPPSRFKAERQSKQR